ncbi:MAG: UbiA-like polyprenyltransferase [Chlamydiales bacterium]
MQKQRVTFSTFKELTRLEMTLFGLPFTFAGALLPFANYKFFEGFTGISWFRFLWIVPAFLAARLSGMVFNQVIDWEIDAKNVRTRGRPIPSGRATPKQAKVIAWSCLVLFIVICSQINPLCFGLSFVAAFLLFAYSYTKRFNALCHFVLGLIHFLAPVMAAAAISGRLNVPAILLGIGAMLSIAANDMVWGVQDFRFDVEQKLFSIPAKFGISNALAIARVCHAGMIICVALICVRASFPLFCVLTPLILAVVYLNFHRKVVAIIQKGELEKIAPLFFSCNVTVPAVTLFFIVIGVLWSHG